MLLRCLSSIMFFLPLMAADYWVSLSGNDDNPGTYSSPWALTKICRTTRGASPISAVSAGDTVWLRGGAYLYNQTLYCDLIGASGNDITLRAAPGEFPYLLATQMGFAIQLALSGSYLKVIGLGAVYSGGRIETAGGSNPAVQVPVGFNVASELLGNPTGVKLINCWSYGNSGTISATSSDHGTLYYGGVNFDQGSDGPDRLHGGWMYQQNDASNGVELAKGNVTLNQPWWYNFRIYTQGGTTTGIEHDSQIVIGGHNFISTPYIDASIKNSFIVTEALTTGSAVQSLLIEDDMIMTESSFGTVEGDASGFVLRSNLMADSIADVGGLYPTAGTIDTVSPTFSGNTLYKAPGPYTRCAEKKSALDWDRYDPSNWSDWLATGRDTGSTCVVGPPPANWLKLYLNEYEPGRAHIAVYSWTSATSQSVDVSSVLNVGDRYELIDLWTPLSAPVATGTYAGGSIEVPLTGTDYYTPWGMGTAGNAARPKACWEVDRANCLTSGDYVVAASVEELPAGTSLYQPALLSSDYAVYYWSGSAWVSAGVTMATHAGPEYKREPNAHAYLLRRVYDGRSDTTLTWRGAITDTVQAGPRTAAGVYQWGQLPVHSVACSGGICSARVPQPVGDAYWRVNGGAALRMAAR